jgi:hypothetical protein
VWDAWGGGGHGDTDVSQGPKIGSRGKIGTQPRAAVLHEHHKALLRPDGHRDPGLLPFHDQVGAVIGVLVQGDGELLHRHRDFLFLHVHARQVLLLMVFGAPLPGLLVDDELPCAVRRERVQGVSSGRDLGAAYIERDGRGERGGFIGAGTPDFSVGRKICPELSALERRTAVVDGDFLAVDGAVGGARRAGTLALVLRLRLGLREAASAGWARTDAANSCAGTNAASMKIVSASAEKCLPVMMNVLFPGRFPLSRRRAAGGQQTG